MQEYITIPTYLIKELPPDKFYALADILSMADENGEAEISERILMNRWGWGNTKVRNFIEYLFKQNICKAPDKAETKHQTKQKQSTRQSRKIQINSEFINSYQSGRQSRNKAPDKAETKHQTKQKTDKNIEIHKQIIEHLNKVCGTNYRQNNQQTIQYINARLSEGFTESDFCTVINKKAKEWLGTEWEKYLRPSTLFGNKFGEYLNQKIVKEKPKNKFNGFPEREYDFSELERKLL